MTKQEIVNYVCETPGNTNPAVLGSMLDSFEEENGFITIMLDDYGIHIKEIMDSNQEEVSFPKEQSDLLFEKVSAALEKNKTVLVGAKLSGNNVNYSFLDNFTMDEERGLFWVGGCITGFTGFGWSSAYIGINPEVIHIKITQI